ncbi:hypothetical protein MX659_06925 [Coriobacteriia bacterium Es71-Z0120]|uniref:tetratricopeptide repeat protein n=1 Tax=Parvivirga hydrogeniphila TaxID=2939460 RepID=UPI002260D568|nr:tetratricopeptide repeat protein [Parvivirga hydrogeniphila]MCL4079313.1 hypothetical protein [Parvivirga hydrogeniphila]
MAIDKTSSPTWVKVVIIAVALSFVASVAGLAAIGSGGASRSSSSSNDAAATQSSIAAKHQPAIDALLAAQKAKPEDIDIITQLGHAYYDYAAELTNAGLADAAQPLWAVAISYYDQVLAKRPDDAQVLGDRAFAAYYSGAPDAAESLKRFIATNDPNLAQQIDAAKQYLSQIGASVPATQSSGTTSTP